MSFVIMNILTRYSTSHEKPCRISNNPTLVKSCVAAYDGFYKFKVSNDNVLILEGAVSKRSILVIVAVFITWSMLDFIIHGMLLMPTYEATASLWRPMGQMDMGLMYFVTLAFASCFVLIYALLIDNKSFASGIKYGALFGLATGISMGFGSYTYMPIPLSLAWGWFFGSLAEAIVAGMIVGTILKT